MSTHEHVLLLIECVGVCSIEMMPGAQDRGYCQSNIVNWKLVLWASVRTVEANKYYTETTFCRFCIL